MNLILRSNICKKHQGLCDSLSGYYNIQFDVRLQKLTSSLQDDIF